MRSILAFAGGLIPPLYGILLVSCLWSTKPRSVWEVLVRIHIGAAVGLGISSMLVFLFLVLGGSLRLDWLLVAEAGLLAILALGAVVTTRREWHRPPPMAPADIGPWSATTRALAGGFGLVLSMSAVAFTYLSLNRPHGGHDAWAIWNLRARFLFRGDMNWRDGFSEYFSWSHPDYPLLLPTNVARGWLYLGDNSVTSPVSVAAVFTFGTVGLMVAAVGLLRGQGQGFLAGVLLLTAPFFVIHGASQYADVPLAFFVLATCVLLALRNAAILGGRQLSFMAGICAGCAAWTKNEGILFFVVMTLSFLGAAVWDLRRKLSLIDVGYFGLGALPFLAMIAYFKMWIAPEGELVAAQSLETMTHRLVTPSRYLEVTRGFARGILKFGGLPLVVGTSLLLYGLILGVDVHVKRLRSLHVIVSTLVLMAGGFYIVYLTVPNDVMGHMRYSLDRLLLQLWPLVVFVYALAIRTAETTGT